MTSHQQETSQSQRSTNWRDRRAGYEMRQGMDRRQFTTDPWPYFERRVGRDRRSGLDRRDAE